MSLVMFALGLALQDPVAPAEPAEPAGAAPAAGTRAAPTTTAPLDDERVICVTEEQTGSLFKKKTCLTAAQWTKRRERDRRRADRVLTPDTSAGNGPRE